MLHLVKVLCLILAATATSGQPRHSETSSEESINIDINFTHKNIKCEFDSVKWYLENLMSQVSKKLNQLKAQSYSSDDKVFSCYENLKRSCEYDHLNFMAEYTLVLQSLTNIEKKARQCLSLKANEPSDASEAANCEDEVCIVPMSL